LQAPGRITEEAEKLAVVLEDSAELGAGCELMKSKTLTYTIAMVVLGALPISVRLSAQEHKDDHRHGHEPKLIEFDAPGAGTGQGFGTVALSINPAGAVTGYSYDASGTIHGFLRSPGEGERGPRSVTILLCLPQAISCQR